MPKKIKKKISYRLSGPGEIKMSEIIAEFAEPLLKETYNEQSCEIAMMMAVACWNLTLLPEEEHEELIGKMLTETTKTDQHRKDTESLARMLIERKKLHFPHIKKFIVKHDIQFLDGKMILNVVSTYLNE